MVGGGATGLRGALVGGLTCEEEDSGEALAVGLVMNGGGSGGTDGGSGTVAGGGQRLRRVVVRGSQRPANGGLASLASASTVLLTLHGSDTDEVVGDGRTDGDRATVGSARRGDAAATATVVEEGSVEPVRP